MRSPVTALHQSGPDRVQASVSQLRQHLTELAVADARAAGWTEDDAHAIARRASAAFFSGLAQEHPPLNALQMALESAELVYAMSWVMAGPERGQTISQAFQALMSRGLDFRDPEQARILSVARTTFDTAMARGDSIATAFEQACKAVSAARERQAA